MLINFQSLAGRRTVVDCNPNDTVNSIFSEIANDFQTTPDRIRLIYKGRVLQADDLISSINYTNGTTIIVQIMKINVMSGNKSEAEARNQPQPPPPPREQTESWTQTVGPDAPTSQPLPDISANRRSRIETQNGSRTNSHNQNNNRNTSNSNSANFHHPNSQQENHSTSNNNTLNNNTSNNHTLNNNTLNNHTSNNHTLNNNTLNNHTLNNNSEDNSNGNNNNENENEREQTEEEIHRQLLTENQELRRRSRAQDELELRLLEETHRMRAREQQLRQERDRQLAVERQSILQQQISNHENAIGENQSEIVYSPAVNQFMKENELLPPVLFEGVPHNISSVCTRYESTPSVEEVRQRIDMAPDPTMNIISGVLIHHSVELATRFREDPSKFLRMIGIPCMQTPEGLGIISMQNRTRTSRISENEQPAPQSANQNNQNENQNNQNENQNNQNENQNNQNENQNNQNQNEHVNDGNGNDDDRRERSNRRLIHEIVQIGDQNNAQEEAVRNDPQNGPDEPGPSRNGESRSDETLNVQRDTASEEVQNRNENANVNEAENNFNNILNSYSPDERQSVAQLQEMGFDFITIIQAFEACERDFERTVSLLLSMS